jgi:hypothetical protein
MKKNKKLLMIRADFPRYWRPSGVHLLNETLPE